MNIEIGMAAVITGGASGLGEATARRLAASGAKVAIFDKNAEAGQAVAKDIGGAFFDVDVTDPASVEAGLEGARAAHGQERITVNCAGVGWAARTVDRDGKAHDAGMFRTTIMINLVGSFNVASMSAAGMAAAETIGDDGERGLIVNTASVAAYDGQIGQCAYAASKAGLTGLTQVLAVEGGPQNIRVNALLPGGTKTEMAGDDPAFHDYVAGLHALKRMAEPEEIARAALFLLSDAGSFVTGSAMLCDGGNSITKA